MKLDADTLSTVPDDPPAAGPERALDPPLRDTGWPELTGEEAGVAAAVVAVPEVGLAVALTMPYVPPPIASAEAPIAMDLLSFRENMGLTLPSFC